MHTGIYYQRCITRDEHLILFIQTLEEVNLLLDIFHVENKEILKSYLLIEISDSIYKHTMYMISRNISKQITKG